MGSELVRLEQDGGLAVVTVDRPPVNALSREVLSQLEAVVEGLGGRDDLRAVIITGAGEKAFVAGIDINLILEFDQVSGQKTVQWGQAVMQKIADLPVPVLAAVNGAALGGGCELALACDLRVAAANARFGQPEVNLGAIPGFGGTQRLPRAIPLALAAEMMFTGRPLTAEEAHRIGLVNRVVPQGQALAAAREMAEPILSKGPLAVRAVKRVLRQGRETTLREGLALEAEAFGELCRSADLKEGARAFLEKRPPRFQGW